MKRKIIQAKLKSGSTVINSVNMDEPPMNEPTPESASENAADEIEKTDPDEKREEIGPKEVAEDTEPIAGVTEEDDPEADEPEPGVPASGSDDDADDALTEDASPGPEHLAYCDNCGQFDGKIWIPFCWALESIRIETVQ